MINAAGRYPVGANISPITLKEPKPDLHAAPDTSKAVNKLLAKANLETATIGADYQGSRPAAAVANSVPWTSQNGILLGSAALFVVVAGIAIALTSFGGADGEGVAQLPAETPVAVSDAAPAMMSAPEAVIEAPVDAAPILSPRLAPMRILRLLCCWPRPMRVSAPQPARWAIRAPRRAPSFPPE